MPDAGGVGDELVARLTELGCAVVTLDPGRLEADLDALAGAPVHGVYWLPALDDEGPLDTMDSAGWRAALRRRVGDLYTVMRRLYRHRPFLVAATRLGGQHGYGGSGATCPLGGAVTGFTKAYRREVPATLAKAVDVAVGAEPAAVAGALVAETRRDPGCVEVGHADGRRWGVATVERPFPPAGAPLGPDTVFLVTGAAGSIVSAVTADLADASAGTFHLLDRTPAPDPADPDLRRFVEDRPGLAGELATRFRDRGERPTPVLIERELARIERAQAALAAITAVERAGGTAHYHEVDLTDGGAVADVLAAVRATSGRVDVLVHGAGLEVSHALPDKEPAEFDLVLGVKADGLFHVLSTDLPVDTVVAFGSVAGRFGNAGQTDYSAANDLQAKVLAHLRRIGAVARVLTIDWTAWAGIGMATRGSIPKVMELAGVATLPAATGVPWVRRELTSPGPDGEVVVAGALGAMAAPWHDTGGLDPAALAGPGPLPVRATRFDPDDGLVVELDLDPTAHPFLDHHRIDGTPVLPGVIGLEAFAEAARLLAPGWHVAELTDVDFLAPVKFHRDAARTITVTTRLSPDGPDLVGRCRLTAERRRPGADRPERRVHFTATVRLTAEPPRPDGGAAEVVAPGEPALTPAEVYRLYFHGPAYQVVAAAWRHGAGVAARFAADRPDQFAGAATAPPVIGPRLVELCFQAAGLWEAGRQGRLALPLHVDAVTLHSAPAEAPELVAAMGPAGPAGLAGEVRDGAGAVVLRLRGYRTAELPDPLPEGVAGPVRSVMTG
jgi:NADP-dependent 3-hydroxy acid dehydrogenase YdfG